MSRKAVCPVVFLLVLSLILSGCKENTRATDQPASSTPVPPAPSDTATITPTATLSITPMSLTVGGLSGTTIHTVCLLINSTFPELDAPAPLDTVEGVTKILAANGIRVVDDQALCEATLQLNLIHNAYAAHYSNGGNCYTGASAVGTITIQLKDGQEEGARFTGARSAPMIIKECPKSPKEAPFDIALADALADGFSQLWSFEFLANVHKNLAVPSIYRIKFASYCLDNYKHDDKEALPCLLELAATKNQHQAGAIHALGKLEEKAQSAIPLLISLLEKTPKPTPTKSLMYFGPDTYIQDNVIEALKAITGQDFGFDAAKWNDWWFSGRLTPQFTPLPCGEYQYSTGKVIRVSGVIDDLGSDEYDTWIFFMVGDCHYNADIWAESLPNFDASLLASLQPGDRVALTGVVTGWNKGLTFFDLQSIDSVEPAK